MYDVATSVLACLRAHTAVHVAWAVSPTLDRPEALAVTPGGGRIGAFLQGAFDHTIAEAARHLETGGVLLELPVGPVEALISGQPEGSTVTVALVTGRTIPTEIWEYLQARRPAHFALRVDGNRLSGPQQLEAAEPGIELTADRLVTSLVPFTRVVVSGSGPIAAALQDAFGLLGWQVSVTPDVGTAIGLMSNLSPIDGVVVMGHEVEPAGRALQAAIASEAGYIASVGSPRMQELRREWLAYRNVGWDVRVRGPAGLPIGASNPAEIALSIAAEAVSILRVDREDR